MRIRALIFILLLLAIAPHLSGSTVQELSDMSSRDLIDLAMTHIAEDTLQEEAAAQLALVCTRWYENQSDSSLRTEAIDAMRNLGNIYMTYLIDYRKAHNMLMTAKQIATEDDDQYRLAFIYVSLTNLYNLNTTDPKKGRKLTVEFLTKAADCALKSHNMQILPVIAMNMVSFSFDNANGDYTKNLDQILQTLNHEKKLDKEGEAARQLIYALKKHQAGDDGTAEKILLEIRGLKLVAPYSMRYRYLVTFMLHHLYTKSGRPRQSVSMLRSELDNLTPGKYEDYRLTFAGELANLYDELQMKDSAYYYYDIYLRTKEEMIAENGYQQVEKLDLLSDIESINTRLENMSLQKQEERRKRIITIAILIAMTIVLFSMGVFYYILRRRHRRLYLINQEMMRNEDMHRQMREKWESELTRLRAIIADKTDDNQSVASSETATAPDDSSDEAVHQDLFPYYTRIIKAMDNSSEIYNAGFSMADLGTLTNLNPRTVSRAINVCHGTNFHVLLNEYRIREAMRRIAAPGSNRITIESIAESCGFRSRTSFATLFKKATGLTPSEYARMSREGS